jgi:predicted DNA-binding transcriptional regulator YafY
MVLLPLGKDFMTEVQRTIMRADRLLSILMLLQTRGQITARELAKRLEVSERTIYRDIEALSTAGVPVYAERGPGGGCMLAEGYRTNLTGLTEDEVLTLFTPGMSRSLADLGVGRALEAALLKLLAALPSSHQQDIEHNRQRLYIDTVGWYYTSEASPFLHTLREAAWKDRKVHLTYRKNTGEITERIVDPLGLVIKAGIWYLVALSHGNYRVFRISRVRNVILLNEPCERPPDFDLEQYWITWSASFRTTWSTYKAKIRVSPSLIPILPQIMGESIHKSIEEADTPDAEGWITITTEFDSHNHALHIILSSGTHVEVLEPQEMRQAVIQTATGIVEFYRAREQSRKILPGNPSLNEQLLEKKEI